MQKQFLVLLVVASAVMTIDAFPRPQFDFFRGAYNGARDMHRAYSDMKDANWKKSDKYFHARGNQDASRHGAGGRWAAESISNLRELTDRIRGQSGADAAADQKANAFGRNGGNLDTLRPKGLPSKY